MKLLAKSQLLRSKALTKTFGQIFMNSAFVSIIKRWKDEPQLLPAQEYQAYWRKIIVGKKCDSPQRLQNPFDLLCAHHSDEMGDYFAFGKYERDGRLCNPVTGGYLLAQIHIYFKKIYIPFWILSKSLEHSNQNVAAGNPSFYENYYSKLRAVQHLNVETMGFYFFQPLFHNMLFFSKQALKTACSSVDRI